MKLRHVRAVAVSVCVVVALTGARRSHGGGCDDSSNSSSSSSSSGGTTGGSTHYDDDDDYDYDTGSSSGSGGATESAVPTEDVKIESCVYDPSRGIVAQVKAANTSTVTTYTYEFGVTFRDPDGAPVRTSDSTIPYVSPNSTDTLDVTATYVAKAGEATTGVTCVLGDVTRTAQ